MVHTLAQNGTINKQKSFTKPMIIVSGNGTDFSDDCKNFARNKRKIITQKLVLSLIDVATQKKDNDSVKEYWNTYYCLDAPISDGKKLYGNYCKNRICTVCSGNRKAELINKYLPVINEWKEPYFVTLTIKSVSARRLKDMMEAVLRGFNLIVSKYKKRYQRGKGKKLIGIRSLECNFNPNRKTYNPHLHIIVPDEETADILIREWLYYCNRKGSFWASKYAQDKRRVFDNEICLVEVIKYGSKIITRPKEPDEHLNPIPAVIYVRALHNILRAMKNIRLFERFGFNLPKITKTTLTKELEKYYKLKYDTEIGDWLDENDIKVSNYILPLELKRLLEYNMDIVLE